MSGGHVAHPPETLSPVKEEKLLLTPCDEDTLSSSLSLHLVYFNMTTRETIYS